MPDDAGDATGWSPFETEAETGDPDRIKARAARRALRQDQVDTLWRELLGQSAGRLLIYDLLDDCGAFTSSYTGEWGSTAFREGRRDIGNRILDRVFRLRPDAYTEMLKEHAARDAEDDGRY